MTDGQVRQAFDEVYNKFWLYYKDKTIPKQSDEWERMYTWGVVLMKKYPYMNQVIAAMIEELDQRMRRREA